MHARPLKAKHSGYHISVVFYILAMYTLITVFVLKLSGKKKKSLLSLWALKGQLQVREGGGDGGEDSKGHSRCRRRP